VAEGRPVGGTPARPLPVRRPAVRPAAPRAGAAAPVDPVCPRSPVRCRGISVATEHGPSRWENA